jgi:hypothetical protein
MCVDEGEYGIEKHRMPIIAPSGRDAKKRARIRKNNYGVTW